MYAVGHLPRLPVDRAHGALLACGPTAVLSHRSAASLWGFYRDWQFPFEGRQVDDGRNRHVVRIDDLWDLAVRLPHAASADRITALLTGGHNPTRSELEALFVDICVLADAPHPLLNVVIGGVEVDAYFPVQRVIVELDSYTFHSGRRVFESDRAKDRNHLRVGIPTIRLTWEAMTFDPEGKAQTLREVLRLDQEVA